jgi:hypothetical protein
MITVGLIWISVFFICFIPGFYLLEALNHRDNENKFGYDEYFFAGFLAFSVVTNFISVFSALATGVLISVAIISILLFLLKIRDISKIFARSKDFFKAAKTTELIVLSLLVLLLLSAAAGRITLYDSGLYHTQSIQWTRNYPVIPGLGNLHGRFAFNSLFLVISALFTFQIKDILIFPLNGLCLLVVLMKLYSLIRKDLDSGISWKSIFYGLTALTGLFILIPDINSASPDIICGVIIMYLFAMLVDIEKSLQQAGDGRILLISLLIFSCISFKLSALFLFLVIMLTLGTEPFKRILISGIVFILIFSAYFVRNYYLSGYLVYPFPGIDIFNADWKIPVENVVVEKLSVESWARIPGIPYYEVAGMNISGWIMPWFRSLNLNSIFLLVPNLFAPIILLLMFIRKDYYLASIQLIIIINLIFWFSLAPDPRFAYGFLFAGTALAISYPFRYFELTNNFIIFKYSGAFLVILFVLVLYQRRAFPVEVISDPSTFIIPDKYESVETQIHTAGFSYRVPVTGDQCFNSEIPCVPYPPDNIIPRGDDIIDGFKVISMPQPGK